MDPLDLVRELRGIKCRCGKRKTSGQTFCRGCYYSLSPEIRSMLYRRLGQGYEEAYSEAVRYLRDMR